MFSAALEGNAMNRSRTALVSALVLTFVTTFLPAEPAATQPASKPTAKAVKPPPPPRKPTDAVSDATYNPKRHQAALDRIKAGPVGLVFIGDSITDFWPSRAPDVWKKFEAYNP